VDAAFHNNLGKTSAGWCVRDYTGRFILAGTSWMLGNVSVIEGDAVALLTAVQDLANRGFTNVMFETDSKIVLMFLFLST
jgi:ribonuclease HI